MRRLWIVLPLVAVLALPQVVEGAAKKKAKDKTPAPDFKALMGQIVDAWETLDVQKVAPYYSQDPKARFFDLAPLQYVGWPAYSAGAAQMFSGFRSLEIKLGNDVTTRHGPKTAWGSATWKGVVTSKDGSVETFEGRWTVIWEKTGKSWVVVHDHFSAPLPG